MRLQARQRKFLARGDQHATACGRQQRLDVRPVFGVVQQQQEAFAMQRGTIEIAQFRLIFRQPRLRAE